MVYTMLCPTCGNPITEELEVCPNCGAALKQAQTAAETETPATPETAAETPAAPETQAFAQADFQETPKKKKKKKPLKVLTIVTALVAVAVVLCVIFWAPIYGFILRTFGTPEAYFQYVEKKEAAEIADSVSGFYDSILENASANKSLMATTSTARIQMSDKLETMLNGSVSAEDLAWLKDAVLKVDSTTDGELSMITMLLTISGTDVLDFSTIFNSFTSEYYIGLPSLSRYFLHYDPNEYFSTSSAGSAISAAQLQELLQSEDFLNALPSEQVVNTLVRRYLELAIENATNVEKDTETLEIGDYKQKVTVLEYRVTQRSLLKMAKAVLKEAKTDRDLKKCIVDFAKYLEAQGLILDADEAYPAYQDTVDQLLSLLSLTSGSSETLFVLTDYVNSSNEIIGRRLTVEGQTVLEYATITKGDNFATEISIANNVCLTGEGTLSGGTREGDYVLEVNGTKYANIYASYDEDKLSSKQQLTGRFRLTPTDEALAAMDGQAALVLSAMNLGIELVVDTGKETSTTELNLVSGKDMLIGLVFDTKPAEAAPITLPSSTLNMESINYWMMTLNYDKLINALEQANVPQEIIDSLVSSINSMVYGYNY